MFIYKNNSTLLICLGKHTTSVRCKSRVHCPKAHNRAKIDQMPSSRLASPVHRKSGRGAVQTELQAVCSLHVYSIFQ